MKSIEIYYDIADIPDLTDRGPFSGEALSFRNQAMEHIENALMEANAGEWAGAEIGRHEVALKALRALAAMRTAAPISRPMALLKQAEIAKAQGDERKAGFLAKKALAEEPEMTDALEFIEALGQA